MKKLISLLLSLSLSSISFAECDFSTGIVRNNDGSYNYTKECNIAVGNMKQDLQIANEQNDKLTKAIDLKDLAITKSDQRADLWQASTFKLEDRINTLDQMQSTNNWMYFGLGVLTVFAAGYAASQVYKH